MTPKPNDYGADVFQQISDICREFGKQLPQGKATRIEMLLKQVPAEAQEILLGNLLGMEVNFRRSQGESPTSDEYIQRFPQFKRQVLRGFVVRIFEYLT